MGAELVELAGLLTEREQEDTRALLLPADMEPAIAHFAQVTPLATLIARRQAQWLIDLLREDRLTAHYQPIFYAETPPRLFAVEALMRGLDANGAVIPAGHVIKAAEDAAIAFQTDLAARLRAVDLFAAGGLSAKLFVNFSPTAIYDPAFCLRTTSARVHELGIKPDQVVFEVVESERHTNLTHLRGILNFYRSEGFSVALDDFGAGYNGLSTLDQLQPDYVKLDMHLVRDVHLKPATGVLVGNLVDACRKLGIRTVAEGIESENELRWLRKHGVDFLQGYHLARPAPIEAIAGSHAA